MPSPVIIEARHLLAPRKGPRAEAEFLTTLADGAPTVVDPATNDWRGTAELVTTSPDLPLDLADTAVAAADERYLRPGRAPYRRRGVRMILCDTDPLVAAFNAADKDHDRCVDFLARTGPGSWCPGWPSRTSVICWPTPCAAEERRWRRSYARPSRTTNYASSRHRRTTAGACPSLNSRPGNRCRLGQTSATSTGRRKDQELLMPGSGLRFERCSTRRNGKDGSRPDAASTR